MFNKYFIHENLKNPEKILELLDEIPEDSSIHHKPLREFYSMKLLEEEEEEEEETIREHTILALTEFNANTHNFDFKLLDLPNHISNIKCLLAAIICLDDIAQTISKQQNHVSYITIIRQYLIRWGFSEQEVLLATNLVEHNILKSIISYSTKESIAIDGLNPLITSNAFNSGFRDNLLTFYILQMLYYLSSTGSNSHIRNYHMCKGHLETKNFTLFSYIPKTIKFYKLIESISEILPNVGIKAIRAPITIQDAIQTVYDRTGISIYSNSIDEPIIDHLTNKLGPLSILEINFAHRIDNLNWVLQHKTDMLPHISGEILCTAMINDNLHTSTPFNFGQHFFSFASIFTKNSTTQLEHYFRQTILEFNREVFIKWKNALAVGYWFGYLENETQLPVRIKDNLITKKNRTNGNSLNKAIKIYEVYDCKTGKTEEIVYSPESEICSLANYPKMVALRLIEILRKGNIDTREYFLKCDNPKELSKLVNEVFSSSDYEIMSPLSIPTIDAIVKTAEPEIHVFDKDNYLYKDNIEQCELFFDNIIAADRFIYNQGIELYNCVEHISWPKAFAAIWSDKIIVSQVITYIKNYFYNPIPSPSIIDKLSPYFAFLCLTSASLINYINYTLSSDSFNTCLQINVSRAKILYDEFIVNHSEQYLPFPSHQDLFFALAIADDIPDEWLIKYCNSPATVKDRLPLSFLAANPKYTDTLIYCLDNFYENDFERKHALLSCHFYEINAQILFIRSTIRKENQDRSIISNPTCMALINNNSMFFKRVLPRYNITLSEDSLLYKRHWKSLDTNKPLFSIKEFSDKHSINLKSMIYPRMPCFQFAHIKRVSNTNTNNDELGIFFSNRPII